MDKEKKSEIHITNNFNAPIGQHIDHVDTINFRMDGDGNFHFGMVENVKEGKQKAEKWEDLLPKELKNDEAMDIFSKAIEAEMITNNGCNLLWNNNKLLLAYFAEKMCQQFNVSNKQDKDGNVTVSWKPFEQLFNVNNLKSAKQNYMQRFTRFEPDGHNEIDSLFI